jgi:hypothetical protein
MSGALDIGNGEVEITSELRGLHLTAMAHPSEWGDVWLDNNEVFSATLSRSYVM